MWKKIKRKLADLIRSASFTEVGVALDYSANWQTRENWKEFSEWMYSTWVPLQNPNGSWSGNGGEDSPVYATSMIILAFAVPYRQLPVYQRDETVDD